MSRAESTYLQLRQSIVRGTIRPNGRLIEADLAAEFAVSRTPVRESLQRLAAEGLVVPAKRGWIVRELSLDEIRDIYEVREALESFAARLTARQGSDEDLQRIESLVDPPSPKHGTVNRSELVFDNDRFHEKIFQASGNSRLIEAIQRNNAYYFNVRVASLYADDELAASSMQHAELAGALLRRDPDKAEAIMRAHVREALRVIVTRFS